MFKTISEGSFGNLSEKILGEFLESLEIGIEDTAAGVSEGNLDRFETQLLKSFMEVSIGKNPWKIW